MVEKVTFDPDNKLIIINDGITSIDVEADMYSAFKRMWKEDSLLNKLRSPFRTVGGDPLSSTLSAGAYFFLQNQAGSDWRIRPYEGDHELTIIGNLYAEDASLPIIVKTLGYFTVSVGLEKSSLTQTPVESWSQVEKGQLLDNVELVKKIMTSRWRIDKSTSLLYIYEGNDSVPLVVLELLDEYGERVDFNKPNPMVYEKRPI